MITGATVESMPRDSPLMITVAAPVSLDEARSLVGRYESDVKYSVIAPIRTPATRPDSTAA